MIGQYYVSETHVRTGSEKRILESAADGFKFIRDKLNGQSVKDAIYNYTLEFRFIVGDDPYKPDRFDMSEGIPPDSVPKWAFAQPDEAATQMSADATIDHDIRKIYSYDGVLQKAFPLPGFPESVWSQTLHWRASIYLDEFRNYADVVWTLTPLIPPDQATYAEYESDGATGQTVRPVPSDPAPHPDLARFMTEVNSGAQTLNRYIYLLENCRQRNAPLAITMSQKSQIMDGLRVVLRRVFEEEDGYLYGEHILRFLRASSPQILPPAAPPATDSGRPLVYVMGPLRIDRTEGQVGIALEQPHNYTIPRDQRRGPGQSLWFKVNTNFQLSREFLESYLRGALPRRSVQGATIRLVTSGSDRLQSHNRIRNTTSLAKVYAWFIAALEHSCLFRQHPIVLQGGFVDLAT